MGRDPKVNKPSQSNLDPNVPVRLSKLMTERGICSRREADALIADGLVYVNGEKITVLGTKVLQNVKIELDPQAKKQQDEFATIMLHKPVGFVSMLRDDQYPSAFELLTPENLIEEHQNHLQRHHFENLSIIGRLDIDSHGLLLFTQDGRLSKRVIGPESHVEKEYLIRTHEVITQDAVKKLIYGLELDGEKLKRAQVEVIDDRFMKMILTQGKKRQIRRMCELVGLKVISLKRVRIAKLKLGDLPRGAWCYVDPTDVFPDF